MAVVFDEMPGSPRIRTDGRERVWLASGSLNEHEIYAAAQVQLAEFDGFGNRTIAVEPIASHKGLWQATATYSAKGIVTPELGESWYEFEIGMQTHRVTQARQTLAAYAPVGVDPATIPDFRGAIGVTEQGVEGVEIMGPVSSFSEIHRLPLTLITEEYRNGLEDIAFCFNNAPFRGRNAGEVLFAGAKGGKLRSEDVAEISFHFMVQKNTWNRKVGDIEGIKHYGWDYLDVYYERQAVTETVEEVDVVTRVLPRPAFAYVQRVYLPAPFGILGIGE